MTRLALIRIWVFFLPEALAFVAAVLMLSLEPARRTVNGIAGSIGGALALGALAASLVFARAESWTPLLMMLVLALLARDREDRLQTECAVKLAWVFGVALALSWAGRDLLTLATGSSRGYEQWAALALQLDPRSLWSTALLLSLLVGVVLVGAAPFHFWLADLLQGGRAWLAPLAAAALMSLGSLWLERRLEGISFFPPGAALIHGLLSVAAAVALLGGALTLLAQRRPERRVGTLASLQGALVLIALATGHVRLASDRVVTQSFAWSQHLALALAGAAVLARLTPIEPKLGDPPAVLFRRHPVTAVLGLYALASLAGVPGTPGSLLWYEAARALAETHHPGVMLAMVVAWIAAIGAFADQARASWGAPTTRPRPERPVPFAARAAMWCAGLGLLSMMAEFLKF